MERLMDFQAGPVTMARALLGQRLVRVVDGVRLAGIIVEVEAYLGARDRAAHTFGGRRTRRNASMYLAGGHAYVYMVYGLHHCLNVVCGPADEGVAVLLRALEPTEGVEEMRRRRAARGGGAALCSGPARLTQAMGIDRSLDGADLRQSGELWIERLPQPRAGLVARSARIGVEYAGAWAARPLRFYLRHSPWTSRPRARL